MILFKRKEKKIDRKSFFIQPDLNENDYFLVSYPRSGSTWLRTLLYYIFTKNETLNNINTLNDYLPDIHNNVKHLGKYSFPRVIKSHRPYSFRHQYWDSSLYKKVIYLYRHPFDVIKSFTHYLCKGNIEKNQFLQIYRQLAYGMIAPGLWQHHYLGWYGASKFGTDLLFVEYEKLERNTKKELLKILDFIEIRSSDKIVDRAIELSDLQNMQKLSFSIEDSLGVKDFIRSSKQREVNFEIPQDLIDVVFENNKEIIMKLY